jgi:hypothetical protein
MKTLLQTMAAVMLAATMVPAYATTTETDEQRMEINKQTSACANTLAPLVTGSILGTAVAIGGAVSAVAGNGTVPLCLSGACGIVAIASMAKWHSLYSTYKNNFSERDIKAIDWKTEELAFRLNLMTLGAIGLVLAPAIAIPGFLIGCGLSLLSLH